MKKFFSLLVTVVFCLSALLFSGCSCNDLWGSSETNTNTNTGTSSGENSSNSGTSVIVNPSTGNSGNNSGSGSGTNSVINPGIINNTSANYMYKIAYLDDIDEHIKQVLKDQMENFASEIIFRLVGIYGFGCNQPTYKGYKTDENYILTPSGFTDYPFETSSSFQTNLDAIRSDINSEVSILDVSSLVKNTNYFAWNWSNFNSDILSHNHYWQYALKSEIETEAEVYLNAYLKTYQKLLVLNLCEMMLDKEYTTAKSLENTYVILSSTEAQNYLETILYGENGVFEEFCLKYDHFGFNQYEIKQIESLIKNQIIGTDLITIDNNKLKNSNEISRKYYKNYSATVDFIVEGTSLITNINYFGLTVETEGVVDHYTNQVFNNLISLGACSKEYNRFQLLSAVKYADVSEESILIDFGDSAITSYETFMNTFGKRIRIKSIVVMSDADDSLTDFLFFVSSISSTGEKKFSDVDVENGKEISNITYNINYFDGEKLSKQIINNTSEDYVQPIIKDDVDIDSNTLELEVEKELKISKFNNNFEAPMTSDGKADGKYNAIKFDNTLNKYVKKEESDCCFIAEDFITNGHITKSYMNYKETTSSYIELNISSDKNVFMQFGLFIFA